MEQHREYWPTSTWRSTPPQEFGIDPDNFKLLHQYAQEEERVRSVLIVYAGSLIFEEYYHGGGQNTYHNINSITKNVTSALIGIALQQKILATVNTSIFSFFPEYTSLDEQERRQAVQLHHLLSLTSGFEFQGSPAVFLEQTTSLEKILSRPMAHEPGTVFSYDDIDIHLISLILARVTGMSTVDFAQKYLFEPLGIWRDEQGQAYPWKHGAAIADEHHPYGLWDDAGDQLWSVERQGNVIGAYGLQLTTREMAKLGYLYLNQGVWDGQQIVPTEYLQASLRPYGKTAPGTGYGYCWYLPHYHGYDAFWAIGFGGQIIACFPELDVVFAMTSRPDEDAPAANHKIMNEGLGPLLEKGIFQKRART
jgi:CubicO group peptidase (beta-lactamase class C family)